MRVKGLILENPKVVWEGGLECGKSAGIMIGGLERVQDQSVEVAGMHAKAWA